VQRFGALFGVPDIFPHHVLTDWRLSMAETKKDVVVSKGELQRAPTRLMGPLEEMDRMFDEFFGRGWLRPLRWERPFAPEIGLVAPKVDVVDRDEEVFVRAQLPGVSKEGIEVSISGNMLTLKGESKREEKEEKGDYYRCEISRGAFARTLTLPAEVDEAKAKAELKDGVLELTLPKVEKSKRRMIKIA
jgi:HSP20 family protein